MAKTAPKYAVVTSSLRELAGSLHPGDRFLSHGDVARKYGVSDGTALRALDTLRRDGWITRSNGVGTFVADPLPTAGHGGSPDDNPGRPGATQAIVAVLALSSDSFFRNCVRLVTAQSTELGLSVVCQYAQNTASFQDAVPLERLQPLGFLIFSYDLISVATVLRERGHRVVIVGAPPVDEAPVVPCVYSDHEYGASLITRRLLDLGHRRIAFVRYDDDVHAPAFGVTATHRWRGHVRTLRAAGVENPEWLIPPATVKRWQEDPSSAREFFAAPDAPTALVAWNDGEAVGLCRLLRLAGLRVPEDISISGYDNLPIGAECDPPLDTVDQHLNVQINYALSLLHGNDAPPDATSRISIPTLVPRASSARPQSS